MARKVNEDDRATKRNQILTVARRLVYSRGYEQMSIQHILDELGISKGAFYHYFDSKPALLEAMVEATQDEVEGILLPIVQDPNLAFIEKLQRFSDTISGWKLARRDFLMALLRVWYMDDNVLARQKITAAMHQRVTPWLAEIVRQGAAQHAFSTASPEDLSQVILTLMVGMGDAVAHMLLALEADGTLAQRERCLRDMQSVTAAFTDAIERAIGITSGSLALFRFEAMQIWLGLEQPQAEGQTL